MDDKIILQACTCFMILLFLSVCQPDVYGQETHSHTHDNSHDHAHTHPHTHLQVDYSFRSDAGQYEPLSPDEEGYYWWKGNLHTHTFWSDGDNFPEVVTQWYYKHGYHFLALSDHNILSMGQKWINPAESGLARRAGGMAVYEMYRERFDDAWIETRDINGQMEVRLKPLAEVRTLFEEPGRFLMIQSEEISERQHTIHVNATNIFEYIEPLTGETVEETIRLNIDAVYDQRASTGQEMVPHLNHPNFTRAVTAEDMSPVENLQLFEVYNGHRGVITFGDEEGTKDLDRIWDIVLTQRVGELGLDMVYGVAVDDAHNYENSESYRSRPGRGWVKVRSKYLTPEHIISALENGEFYSTTGIGIRKMYSDGERYRVAIEPEDGVKYTIQFIGTREGYDSSSRAYVDGDGQVRDDRTRLYSDEIGEMLKEVNGTQGEYEFEGDELYVRVKVISSKIKENPFREGELENAWLQPVRPGNGSH